MKQSNEDKIKVIEGQLKLCSRVSILACILTVLVLVAEFFAAGQFKGASWAGTVVKLCTYICYVMPFVIVIPLFVRSNLKVRLHNIRWKEEHKEE